MGKAGWRTRGVTRAEYWHLIQTKRDLVTSLPLILWFILPTVGFLAPVLGFLYPRQLMSHQFWNHEQRCGVYEQEYRRRCKVGGQMGGQETLFQLLWKSGR